MTPKAVIAAEAIESGVGHVEIAYIQLNIFRGTRNGNNVLHGPFFQGYMLVAVDIHVLIEPKAIAEQGRDRKPGHFWFVCFWCLGECFYKKSTLPSVEPFQHITFSDRFKK
jgi:hypothetical protein